MKSINELEGMKAYTGDIRRVKFYPIALSSCQIVSIYKREKTWWGRILNDIDHYLKQSGM